MFSRRKVKSVYRELSARATEDTLCFQHATVDRGPLHDSSLWDVDFILHPGDLLLVLLERGHSSLPLADAASGVDFPIEGEVHFLGKAWREIRHGEANQLRGRIGRTFDDKGWVSHLTVLQNIVLSQMHHTTRSEEDILEEADHLSRMFGLPGLPTGRPDQLRTLDLQCASCVRAFMGSPELIILENPVKIQNPNLLTSLLRIIPDRQEKGTAILWTTPHADTWNDPAIRPTKRYRVSGSQMKEILTDG